MITVSRKPEPELNIRMATEKDALAILQLFAKYFFPIAHFKPDVKAVGEEIYRAATNDRVFVLEDNNHVIGCAMFCVATPWYLSTPLMMEQGIMIDEEYHNTSGLARLWRALKTESESRGLELIVTAGTQNDRVATVMAKQYRIVAQSFLVH